VHLENSKRRKMQMAIPSGEKNNEKRIKLTYNLANIPSALWMQGISRIPSLFQVIFADACFAYEDVSNIYAFASTHLSMHSMIHCFHYMSAYG
jgi:hypothetical protein